VVLAPERMDAAVDLPVEITDIILRQVVRYEGTSKHHDMGLLMEVVLCFVCRTWKDREVFWGTGPTNNLLFWGLYDRFGPGVLLGLAAAENNEAMIKWLIEKKCAGGPRACSRAAKRGDLDLLKILRGQGCDWNGETLRFAASGGHLELMKWARENGCPWSPPRVTKDTKESNRWFSVSYSQPVEASTCCGAAQRGHLEVLKWMKEVDHMCANNPYAAAKGGQLEVLKWLNENDKKSVWNSEVYATAAAGGHFEVLKWLAAEFHDKKMDPRCRMRSDTCEKAAKNGHLEILKWANQKGVPFSSLGDESTCCKGPARGGHLEVLKWLIIEKGKTFNDQAWCEAARGGHLKVLRWARESGYTYLNGANVAAAAAAGGHLEVLQFMKEIGCEFDERTSQNATRGGHHAMISWLKEIECPQGLQFTSAFQLDMDIPATNLLLQPWGV